MAAITTDLWPHPLTTEGRATRRIPVGEGSTLASLVDLIIPGAASARVVAAAVDGRPIPQEAWIGHTLRDGEIVTLRRSLAGGGDGRKILHTVLTIAVIVASFYFAPAVATAFAISAAAAQTAILVGGSILVNALLPPPDAPRFTDSGSPEIAGGRGYSSITTQNQARPHQPMLLVLGTHRVFGDLVGELRPYVSAGDQVFELLLSEGIGFLERGEVSFGSARRTTLQGFTIANGRPDEHLRSDTYNTQEVGVTMEKAIRRVWRAAHPDARQIVIGLETRLGYTNDDGDAEERTVVVSVGG